MGIESGTYQVSWGIGKCATVCWNAVDRRLGYRVRCEHSPDWMYRYLLIHTWSSERRS